MSHAQEPLLVGEWQIDPAADEIRRGGESRKLEPRTMALLVYLAHRPGQVVPAEELLDNVWKGVIVTGSSVYQTIALLRAALGDDADNPRYVVTVPRKGYRLIAKVERGARAAGLQAQTESLAPPASPRRRWWRPVLIAAIVLLGLAYLLTPESLRQRLLGVTPAQRSIAVLPFQNIGADPNEDYLSDGLTEDLLQSLGRLPGVDVTARSSAFVFRKRDQDVRDIARKLGVRYVLDGSVRRERDRLRVNAQLIDATTGFALWSESYDRPFADVLRVQEDISRSVARSLAVILSRDTSQRLARRAGRDAEAFDAYLQGRYFWNERSADSLRRAAQHFAEAIERDPDFAPAYVALAELDVVMPLYGVDSPDVAFPRAREQALRALQLDDAMAEARATLAVVLYQHDWDWKGAEQEFRKAIALNPSYATARQWYAEFLSYAGRFEEAEAEMGAARVLDPLSPTITTLSGSPALWSRRYSDCEKQYSAAATAHPHFGLAHYSLGLCRVGAGQAQGAVGPLREAWRALGADFVYPTLAHAYAGSGRAAEARELLAAMLAAERIHYISPYKIAVTYAAVGEIEPAFERLAQAEKIHDDRLVLLAVDPLLDRLRNDARFASLLARIIPRE
jgi:TolB-like protein/DNA-binding winged helix-turn-helix (wHTH) protein/Tfp pilus assembly protein PilF